MTRIPTCRVCGDVIVVDEGQDPICVDCSDPLAAAIRRVRLGCSSVKARSRVRSLAAPRPAASHGASS